MQRLVKGFVVKGVMVNISETGAPTLEDVSNYVAAPTEEKAIAEVAKAYRKKGIGYSTISAKRENRLWTCSDEAFFSISTYEVVEGE